MQNTKENDTSFFDQYLCNIQSLSQWFLETDIILKLSENTFAEGETFQYSNKCYLRKISQIEQHLGSLSIYT